MNIFSYGAHLLALDIGSVISGVLSIIPKTAYMLANSFLGLLDLFQLWFRKLAGLDVYYVDGVAQQGDIVYQFIRGVFLGEYPALHNVFIGLVILGVILLILSTIIAIIRNEYTAEKGQNSKSKIIGQSFKSIIYVAIIPVICLLGVFLSNVILGAVDKATSMSSTTNTILNETYLEPYTIVYNPTGTIGGGSETTSPDSVQTYISYNIFGVTTGGSTTQTFSGLIFKASCYGANRVRNTEGQQITSNGQTYDGFFELLQTGRVTNFGGLFTDDGQNPDVVAMYIDQAFADNVKLKSEYATKLDYTESFVNDATFSLDIISNTSKLIVNDSINRFNIAMVSYYYDLWQFNFIVCFGAGIFMTVILINIIFGLIKRLVELVALFMVSAPLISIWPLDGGKAYNSWRSNFLKKTLMAYGAVAGMNIIFLLLPYFQEISFFNQEQLDGLANTVIIMVALLIVKDFIAIISDALGAANAESEGGDISQKVGSTIAKAGMMTVGAGAVVGAGAAMAIKGAHAAGSAIKKQITAKSRWQKAQDEHKKKMDDKRDQAQQDRDNAINDMQAQAQKDAENSITEADEQELRRRSSYTVKDSYGHTHTMVDQKEYKKRRQAMIDGRRDQKIKDGMKNIQKDYAKKINDINQEEASSTPELYDFQVHGITKAKETMKGGALNAVQGAKKHGKELIAGEKKISKRLMAASSRFAVNSVKIGGSSVTDAPFAKGMSEGAGKSGIVGSFTDLLAKDFKKKKALDKAAKEEKERLEKERKGLEKLRKEAQEKGEAVQKTTEELLQEIINKMNQQ